MAHSNDNGKNKHKYGYKTRIKTFLNKGIKLVSRTKESEGKCDID
jgi:hypothetical protein